MAEEQASEAKANAYILDTESGAEMTRLMRQDQLITQGMGGIFPEKGDLSGAKQVLDLACGPGGWVLETAFAYPEMQVTGVDISEKMITYAQTQAELQRLPNAHFQVMNVLQPLNFPDASFDLVNARFLVGFLHRDRWPELIRESLRLLRPGGTLRWTEVELNYSNKASYEKAWWVVLQGMSKHGLGFSPHGLHFSIFPMLLRMFRDAGVEQVEKMAHVVDFSAGTVAHEGFYADFVNAFQALEPFLLKSGLVTLQEWREMAQKGLAEMFEDDFNAAWILLTVWGRKQ